MTGSRGRSMTPRVAVLGAGAWGANHVRTWHELGHLAVVADLAEAARERVRSLGLDGVDVVDDLDTVLVRDDVDAVVVATPATSHAKLALAAIAAGKDVLIEKPMAVTLEEALAVHAAAAASDRVVMVGHVLEYHPAFRMLRALLGAGELGELRYLYSNRLNFGKIRTEENALWSFAPHDMALFLRLVGRAPTEVACHGGSWLSPQVADVTVLHLDFGGEVLGHVFVSWLHPFKEQRLVVVGADQMAVFDDTAAWGDKLVLYRHEVEWELGRPVALKAEGRSIPMEQLEPLRAECEHFLACVRDRGAPLTDTASGVRVLELLDAGGRSLLAGGVPVGIQAALP